MPRDYQPLFAVGHDEVPTLPGHAVAKLFKRTLGVALSDAGNFRHRC